MAVDQIIQASTQRKKKVRNCFGCRCSGAGSWGCRGLCQGRPGAAPCQTQPVPAGSDRPTTGHVWARQPRRWSLCENLFNKGQRRLEGKRRRNTRSEKQHREHQGERRRRKRRKRRYSVMEHISTLQPMEDPHWTGGIFLREQQPVERTYAGAGRKCEEEGAVD